MTQPITPVPGTQYCTNHPDRVTMLRCNRCDRPMCTECLVLTPTGYRCKECVRGQLKVFETARTSDYVVALLIAGAISFVGSLIATFLGFFTLFVAPIVGVIVAEAVRAAVQKRRSKLLFQVTAVGVVVGGILPSITTLIAMLLLVSGGRAIPGFGSLLNFIWPLLYLFLATSSAYYRLSGIQIR